METSKNFSAPEHSSDNDPKMEEHATEVISPPEKDSFAAKIQDGLKNYQKILNEEPSPDLSTETTLLFSKVLSDAEDTPSFPYQETPDGKINVTVFGLETSDERYPFDENTKKLAHLSILEEAAKIADNTPGKLLEGLAELDEEISAKLIRIEQDKLVSDKREEYKKQAEMLRAEDAKPYKKNDRKNFALKSLQASYDLTARQSEDVYNKAFDYNRQLDIARDEENATRIERAEALARNIQLELLNSYNIQPVPNLDAIENNRRKQFDEFIIQNGYMSESELDEFKTIMSDTRRDIRSQLRTFLNAPSADAVFTNGLNPIESLVMEDEKQKWLRENPNENLKKTYTKPFDKRHTDEPIPTFDEAKASVREYFVDRENLLDRIVQKWENTCRRYYGELVMKHRKAEVIWGSVPVELRELTAKKIGALNQDLREFKACESYIDAKNNIESLKIDLAKKISKKDYSKVFWLPTGFVGENLDGSLSTQVVSPFDSRLSDLIPENLQGSWHDSWSQYDKNLLERFSYNTRKNLNQDLKKSVNPEDLKPYEKELHNLSEKYDFILPPTINVSTGRLDQQISEKEVPILSELMPSLSKYIDEVIFEEPIRGYQDANTIQKQILNYLNGSSQSPFNSIYSSLSDHKTLNLAELAYLANSSNLAIFPLTSIMIGLDTYHNLPSNLQNEYLALHSPQKLNIPEITFNRLFKRRVLSALERKKLLARSLFVSDFRKHLANKPLDPGVQEFFSKNMI